WRRRARAFVLTGCLVRRGTHARRFGAHDQLPAHVLRHREKRRTNLVFEDADPTHIDENAVREESLTVTPGLPTEEAPRIIDAVRERRLQPEAGFGRVAFDANRVRRLHERGALCHL